MRNPDVILPRFREVGPEAARHERHRSAWVGWAAWIVAFPARVLLGLIWLYRRTLSPALPAIFGPGCGCRFHPTCAVYAAGAVRRHGALLGAWLAVRRLLKCHPFNPGGFDPVPPRRPVAYRVRRQAAGTSLVTGPGPRVADRMKIRGVHSPLSQSLLDG